VQGDTAPNRNNPTCRRSEMPRRDEREMEEAGTQILGDCPRSAIPHRASARLPTEARNVAGCGPHDSAVHCGGSRARRSSEVRPRDRTGQGPLDGSATSSA
jgi:hypothetical protein